MAEQDGRVVIGLDLDDSSFKRGLKNVETTAKSSGEKTGRHFAEGVSSTAGAAISKLRGQVSALGATLATAFAARTVIQAAARQEEAVNKLNASLRNLGQFSKETSSNLQEYASSLQSVTRFGDEAILEQLAFAQALGATVDQSQRIVKASTDIAEALSIDLNSAVRLVSKTLGGYVGELGEVIPEIKQFSKEQLQAGAAIDFLQQKFKGFAGAATQTFAGAAAQASNSLGDLGEEIGFLITKNPLVIKTLSKLNVIFTNTARLISENRTEIIDFINKGLIKLRDTYNDIVASITKFKRELINIAALSVFILASKKLIKVLIALDSIQTKLAVETIPLLLRKLAVLGPKGLAVAGSLGALAAAGAGVKAVFDKFKESPENLTEAFQKFNGQVIDLKNQIGTLKRKQEELKASGNLTPQIDEIFSLKLQDLTNKLEIAQNQFQAVRDKLAGKDAGTEGTEADPNSLLSIIKQVREELSRPLPNFQQGINDVLEAGQTFGYNFTLGIAKAAVEAGADLDKFGARVKKFAADVKTSLQNGVAQAAGSAFAAFGAAVARGEDPLKAFTQALFNAIGQQAIALGTRFIYEGIAISANPFYGGPAVGGPIIAAGATLAAFGGALSALTAPGAGSGAATAGAGAGAVDFGGPEEDLVGPEEIDREPTATVVFNIQGSILSTDQTADNIVDLINDSFEQRGVRILQA